MERVEMLALLFISIVSLGKLLNLSDTRIADWLNQMGGVTNKFLMLELVLECQPLISWT